MDPKAWIAKKKSDLNLENEQTKKKLKTRTEKIIENAIEKTTKKKDLGREMATNAKVTDWLQKNVPRIQGNRVESSLGIFNVDNGDDVQENVEEEINNDGNDHENIVTEGNVVVEVEQIVQNDIVETQNKKNKTPKEYRKAEAKKVIGTKVKEEHKKMFKETFNTDKSRLDKRQTKLNLPQDFVIIMLDNVHKVDSDGKSKSKTAGKYMVYAKGTCKDKFLGDGIKYSKDQFYVHKNNYDFEEEVIKVNRRLQNNDNNVSIQDGEAGVFIFDSEAICIVAKINISGTKCD